MAMAALYVRCHQVSSKFFSILKEKLFRSAQPKKTKSFLKSRQNDLKAHSHCHELGYH